MINFFKKKEKAVYFLVCFDIVFLQKDIRGKFLKSSEGTYRPTGIERNGCFQRFSFSKEVKTANLRKFIASFEGVQVEEVIIKSISEISERANSLLKFQIVENLDD